MKPPTSAPPTVVRDLHGVELVCGTANQVCRYLRIASEHARARVDQLSGIVLEPADVFLPAMTKALAGYGPGYGRKHERNS